MSKVDISSERADHLFIYPGPIGPTAALVEYHPQTDKLQARLVKIKI